MALKPIVRYMILCDGWCADPPGSRHYTIVNLLTNLQAKKENPYPHVYPKLCVFLALTEGRGIVEGHVSCVFEETGLQTFQTPPRQLRFGSDPLQVRPFTFNILECKFPNPGLYTVQFWCEGELLADRPLRLR